MFAPRRVGKTTFLDLDLDLVKALSAEGQTDVEPGVRRFLQDERQTHGWQALLRPLDLFDRAVLWTLAAGRPPMGRETRCASGAAG